MEYDEMQIFRRLFAEAARREGQGVAEVSNSLTKAFSIMVGMWGITPEVARSAFLLVVNRQMNLREPDLMGERWTSDFVARLMVGISKGLDRLAAQTAEDE